jgi:tetratricopeptide (TPR) repeat protein
MSEAHRSDAARAHDPASDADRDAKIEQLLLVGLDHYFAAQYDQAINVWTRALFLDRTHPRARAYIDRARSALAERQRESEELLQNGIAAFHRGDIDEARHLLRAGIDNGAPSEEALALLDRIDRLETGGVPSASATSEPARRFSAPRSRSDGSLSALAMVMVVVASVAVVALAGYAAMSWDRIEWRAYLPLEPVPATIASPVIREQALPLPRRGEIALTRARAFAASGRLSDALTTLDSVRATDPQKPEADRLRADIQRQLLALTDIPDRRVP